MKSKPIMWKIKLKWAFLSSLVGVLAGLASAFFLWSLYWVTSFRESHQEVIWALPVAGLFIGWACDYFGKHAAGNTSLILDEIHQPNKVLSPVMAPLVLLGTLLTHLTGGSAGREGTAVQMGASLADQIHRFIPIEKEERKILLIAGMGAGFSGAIGAPWAGALFGLEILQIGKLRLFALVECLMASFVSYGICLLLRAPHSVFPQVDFRWSLFVFLSLVPLGILFGSLVRIFVSLTHGIERLATRILPQKKWHPFWGGLILLSLYLCWDASRWQGLGIPVIQEAFGQASPMEDFLGKIFFTALTLGMGFKGGEFIPLVFIGVTFGSYAAGLTGLSTALCAGLGFSAVFGAASNAPLACAMMAAELLGWKIGAPALAVGLVAYWTAGKWGIYSSQRVARSKQDQILFLLNHFWPWSKRN